MKVHQVLIKLFIILSIFFNQSSANVSRHGSLKSGEKVIIKPQNNYAFSITKTKGMAASHASYNVKLVNGGTIVYEDKNLVDDIYLVFHDDILPEDRMHIEVNRGYFDYSLTSLLALPKIVKDVIEPEVIEKAKHPKPRHIPNKIATITPKDHLTFVKEPETTIVNSRDSSEMIDTAKEEQINQDVAVPTLEGDISYSSPIGKTFFEKFTKIFKELVESFSFKSTSAQAATLEKKSKPLDDNQPQSKATMPQFNDTGLKEAAAIKDAKFTTAQRGIQNPYDDSGLKESARVQESTFTAPQRGVRENFDDNALQQSALVSHKTFSKQQPIAIDSTLPTHSEEKFPDLPSREPSLYKDTFSKRAEQVPVFNSTAPQTVDKQRTKSIEDVPTFKETKEPQQSNQQSVQYASPTPTTVTPAYPDTGYKKGYESLEQSVATLAQEKPARQRVVEDTSLPVNSASRSDSASEKLVITKIIDKEEPQADPFAGRVLGRMDDRVLGNGYNGTASSAKLGMRVTKNSRPVSAWIEVFKNGTKQRIKTFYTSKGRKTKHVKLPAGNYMVRATYRTRDTKYQKTIKNIHLSEGDNVNRSVAFHDGKVRIIARRGDAPLYVKVVVYKSGSDRRVTYDFSSRRTGIAQISLSSGTYDIEVLEHKNNRRFDGIRIKAGQINTIHADF